MASQLYNSVLTDLFNNNVGFAAGTFKVVLLTSAYTPSKAHAKRSDLTNEVSGTGYTAGGNTVAATVAAVDNTNNRQDVSFAATTWPTSTITARYAVYYKANGGAASADQLIGVDDFGSDVSSANGVFSLGATVFRLSNP